MKTRILISFLALVFGLFAGQVFGGTEGSSNTFYGTGAGSGTTVQHYDTFIGAFSGYANTIGEFNTFLGYSSGYHNGGDNNTFIGNLSGYLNTTGYRNTLIGSFAGYDNTTGNNNAFFGYQAGADNTNGSCNTFIGNLSGVANTTGYYNTFIGNQTGYLNTTGAGNVFLGYATGYTETGSNKLYIANSSTTTPLIYGEFDNQKLTVNGDINVVGPNGSLRFTNTTADSTTKIMRIMLNHYSNSQLPVYLFRVDSTPTLNRIAMGGGQSGGTAATQIDFYTAANNTTPTGTSRLTIKNNGYIGVGTKSPAHPLQMAGGAYSDGSSWYSVSSREYKQNIKALPAEDALEALAGLNPVTFTYKASPEQGHVGFIAEDVPTLVATKDRKGLSAMDIVAVLTKALQEQQKINQEYKKALEEQQKLSQEQQKINQELSNKMTVLERELKLKGNLADASF